MNEAQRFGNAYFSQSSRDESWTVASNRFNSRLGPLLQRLGEGPRERASQTIRFWRARCHSHMRALTQLGRGESGGMRVEIAVSDRIPPPVLAILDALPDSLLWVLFHLEEISATRDGLVSVWGDYSLLTAPGGFTPPKDLSRNHLQKAATFFTELEGTSGRRAEEALHKILALRSGDWLGAYYFREVRIELFWIPIWMVASRLQVSLDDLTIVVLAHELAHYYTHVGKDASGHDWQTEDFANCADTVVEGLAQFYTEAVCVQLKEQGIAGPLQAFQRLLPNQSDPYQLYSGWAVAHPSRAEVFRNALVQTRVEALTAEPEFVSLVEDHAQRLRPRQRGRQQGGLL